MTLFKFIGESVPTFRTTDLLTVDHPHRPYPPEHPIRYSLLIRAAAFVVLMLVGYLVFISVYAAVTGTFNFSVTAAILAELLIAIFAYLVLTMVTESRVWPHEIKPQRILGLFKGMLLGLIMVSVCIGILALMGSYTITGFNAEYSPWLDIFFMGVVAGVAEELMMRGALFRLTEEGLGSWGAVVVSALVFGFLHLGNFSGTVWGAVAISIEAGLTFAAIYIITRSLWWCIGVHFAWNVFLGPVFGSIVSGTERQHSWFESHFSGPEILTGGAFGMEASIVSVIILGGLGITLLVFAQVKGLMVLPIWMRKARLTDQRHSVWPTYEPPQNQSRSGR